MRVGCDRINMLGYIPDFLNAGDRITLFCRSPCAVCRQRATAALWRDMAAGGGNKHTVWRDMAAGGGKQPKVANLKDCPFCGRGPSGGQSVLLPKLVRPSVAFVSASGPNFSRVARLPPGQKS
jgi:hypothetical protein